VAAAEAVWRSPLGKAARSASHHTVEERAVLSALQLLQEVNFAAKKLANKQDVWMGKHQEGEFPNAQ
jgi:hypothetical protein